MAYAVIVVAALFLAGCAWPSKTHRWCAPSARVNHEKQAAYVGVRCAW